MYILYKYADYKVKDIHPYDLTIIDAIFSIVGTILIFGYILHLILKHLP